MSRHRLRRGRPASVLLSRQPPGIATPARPWYAWMSFIPILRTLFL